MFYRNQRGNMLFLTLVTLCFVALISTIFLSFGWVFVTQERLQNTGNELALYGTTFLNSQDRIGQLNNCIARSRQLVYSSHEVADQIHTIDPDLQGMSDFLLDQAKEGSDILDKERETSATKMRDEAKQAITAYFNQIKGSHFMMNPFIETAVPQIASVDFGYINNIEDNVESFKGGIDELEQWDNGHKTWEKNGNLHKANNNAKLPGFSQNYYLSSLSAPVDGVVAPARVALGSSFKQLDDKSPYVPSALRVQLKTTLKLPFSSDAQSVLRTTSVGTTTGGDTFQ